MEELRLVDSIVNTCGKCGSHFIRQTPSDPTFYICSACGYCSTGFQVEMPENALSIIVD